MSSDEIYNFLSQHEYASDGRDGAASHVWELGVLDGVSFESPATALANAVDAGSEEKWVSEAREALFGCLVAAVAHTRDRLVDKHAQATTIDSFLDDGEEQGGEPRAPANVARLVRALEAAAPAGNGKRGFARDVRALSGQLAMMGPPDQPLPPHVACIGLLADAVVCLDGATPSGSVVARSAVAKALLYNIPRADATLSSALTVAGAIVLFGNAPRHFSDAAVVYRGAQWRTLRGYRASEGMWPAYATEPATPNGGGGDDATEARTFDMVVAIPGGRRYALAILCEAAEAGM
jgi:hypothetical protein